MVVYERCSLTRGSKYSDLTSILLVFWKTGRWGEVVTSKTVLSVWLRVDVPLLQAPTGADKRRGPFSSSGVCRNTAGNPQESTRRSSGRSRVLLKALQEVVVTRGLTVLTFQQHTQLSPSTQWPSNTASVGNNILQGTCMGRCAGPCTGFGSLWCLL